MRKKKEKVSFEELPKPIPGSDWERVEERIVGVFYAVAEVRMKRRPSVRRRKKRIATS